MANQHSFAKKAHLWSVPIRLGTGLALMLMGVAALSSALIWMAAQAQPILAGDAPAGLAAPDAITAADETGACCLSGGMCLEDVT